MFTSQGCCMLTMNVPMTVDSKRQLLGEADKLNVCNYVMFAEGEWFLCCVYKIITEMRLYSGRVSCDMYDKKCPFGKSFEALIKDCCACKLESRISINKLVDHKFFNNANTIDTGAQSGAGNTADIQALFQAHKAVCNRW